MRKFREVGNRSQIMLLPRTVEEFVGKDDLVRYIDLVVNELDISAIENAYSTLGRPAYSPRMLVKILSYGKTRGIHSSRELARACCENMRFIFLANDERPDFRTISDFRKRFQKELSSLLKQTIEIGIREEIIDLEHVAIDGTKLGAWAGRNSFKRPKDLEEKLQALEKELEASFAKDIAEDDKEDSHFGDDNDGQGKLPKELEDKERLRDKIKAALNHYHSIRKEKPKKVSLTDPESRFMRSKGTNPSYTGMAAVDASSGMVVAGYATNAVSENAELIPSLEQIEENTGMNPKVATADAGFSAYEGFGEFERRNIDGYVPLRTKEERFTLSDFTFDEEKKSFICPNGKRLTFKCYNHQKESTVYQCKDCSGCPLIEKCMPRGGGHRTLSVSDYNDLVQEMIRKMDSPHGASMAKVRSATVEHVFGTLKAAKKLRQLMFRGLKMVNSMWRFDLTAYNVEKLARLLQQKRWCATS